MHTSSQEVFPDAGRKRTRRDAQPIESVSEELVELQQFMRHIYSELDRYGTDDETYQKHEVDKITRSHLRDVVEAKLDQMSIKERADWKRLAESLDGKFSPIIQGAREADKDRRMRKLREWHQLDKIDQCDNEIVDILAGSGLDGAGQLELRQKLEVLKTGEELHRKVLSEDSTNAPTRRFLKKDDKTNMVAYGKSVYTKLLLKLRKLRWKTERVDLLSILRSYSKNSIKKRTSFIGRR